MGSEELLLYMEGCREDALSDFIFVVYAEMSPYHKKGLTHSKAFNTTDITSLQQKLK